MLRRVTGARPLAILGRGRHGRMALTVPLARRRPPDGQARGIRCLRNRHGRRRRRADRPADGCGVYIDSPTTPTNPKGFLKPDLDTLPFYVLWNAEDTTWGLFYGSTCESLNGVWDAREDFVTIQTTTDRWTLETSSRPEPEGEGNVWLCTMLVDYRGKEKKDPPSPWTKVGRFDVPTLMTLDKLSGP